MKDRQKKQSNKAILLQIIDNIASLKVVSDDSVSRIIAKNPSVDSFTYSKSQVLEAYNRYKNTIKLTSNQEKKLLEGLKMKKIRTMSGVTPVAVLTKPFPCPGNCIYCPNDPKMPKSYLSAEPGAQRALQNEFDPYLQVYNRLLAYKNIGHPTDKVELIVLGGTWSFYPQNYQIWFIKRAFDAMNDFNSRSNRYLDVSSEVKEKKVAWEDLFQAQKKNEKAHSRCVGLVLETRPDYIDEKEAVKLRKFGCTKVQIGVQSLDDKILNLNKRGHKVKETRKAFEILRSAGFKIHAHWMPNLYGSNPEKDIEDYKKLFSGPFLRPDELKIYPCSLINNTELYKLYKNKKWKPYTEKQLIKVLSKCFEMTPRYCRISRVVRDISSDDIVAGNKKSNFRQIVDNFLKVNNIRVVEIRSREIKNEKISFQDLEFKKTSYDTSNSREYFLEYVTKEDKIVGFLRLSLPKNNSYIKELKDSAIIREVHVYGESVKIGKTDSGKPQHLGIGSVLINKAESLSAENGFNKISVISSIGTREYYSKRGYRLVGLYQSKKI